MVDAPAAPRRPPTNAEVLGNREFRVFLVGNSLFHFCATSLTVMLAFHVYELRENPLDLALLGFVQVIPALTLAFHAGDVADKRLRRGLVTISFAALGFVALALAVVSAAGAETIWLLLVGGFASATIRTYENPANVGLEAQIIPRHHILKALPMVATAGRVADMAGPVLMGVLWAQVGAGPTYGAMAILLGVSTLLVALGIAQKPVPEVEVGLPPLQRIREGWTYVWRNQVLFGSMLLDLCAVFFGGAAALLPIFATDILEAGPDGFGLLRSAIAAGTFVAAVTSIYAMPAARAGHALHLIVVGFGLSMMVFALSTSFWLSMAMLFLAGICDGFSMVIRHAILRVASPEHMRGRIAAVRMIFVASSNELGAMQSGTMATLIGPVRAVVVGGTITVAVAVVIARKMPLLWRLNLHEHQAEPIDKQP
ncbi:MFS transporter [Histidinibacterium aquaticum]|uniref:MFS transporter n=1 Tax=Histidinibacterium aquaticum TaxID=2613962 RepID=A0A5J5GBZ7_9RHOB|nr:MFS transporter [Histidinibacterium aquaticum]KAA9005541.1 MFS transporter [Histidinibacterium aquaticum]